MENLVTVIIPVYNSERYLKKCIESVILQKYRALEIIIIDDGSTDGSIDICNEYQKKDSRIVLIHQENKGVSSARNIGIENAAGKYICFIDSDDYVDPEYVLELLKNIEQPDVDLSVCTLLSEYAPGRWNKKEMKDSIIERDEGLISLFSRQGMFGGPVCKLYKIKILNQYGIRFNENIKMCEDNLFCYEYIRRCKKIVCSSKALYFYCYNTASASTKAYSPTHIADSMLHFKAYREIGKTIKQENILVNKYYLTIYCLKWIRLVYRYNLFACLSPDDIKYVQRCIKEAYKDGIKKELKMKKGSYVMGLIIIISPKITRLVCKTKRLYWRKV